jgi:hypothetical protein
MSVLTVRDALLTVTQDVYHFGAPEGLKKYIVWGETGPGSEDNWSDNRMQQQTISGLADYYTNVEYDADVDAIQQAFSDADISFGIIAIEHFNDTHSFHYQWRWEIICSFGDMYGAV